MHPSDAATSAKLVLVEGDLWIDKKSQGKLQSTIDNKTETLALENVKRNINDVTK